MAVGEDAPTILSTRTLICSPLSVTGKATKFKGFFRRAHEIHRIIYRGFRQRRSSQGQSNAWFGYGKLGGYINIKRSPPFERVSATVGLCFRETGFCQGETAASKRPVTFNRSSTETKSPHENPPIRRYSHGIGKSLFVWDCVVGLRGLELGANHAVAIEAISGPSNSASESPKNPRERTGNRLQKER